MPKTILVIEDTDNIRTLLRILLKRQGYDVIEATNWREAIESVRSFTPHLILTDISLPEMNGLEITRIIRKIEGFEKIPIIAVSAQCELFHKRAKEAGCNDLIDKPLDFQRLESALKKHLR
jgi:two-component system chemotaxis response regulator CheY